MTLSGHDALTSGISGCIPCAPWPVAAGIAFGSSALLFLRSLGIEDLAAIPHWFFGIVWIVFVYASVVLLIRWAQAGGAWVKQVRKKKRRRSWINQNLDTLGGDERAVFKYLLENNQRSFAGRIASGEVAPLVQKRLLIRGEGSFSYMEWPHTVPDDVWKELVRRQDEFIDLN